MTPLQVLFIDLTVATILIFYLLRRKRSEAPTQLKLKGQRPTPLFDVGPCEVVSHGKKSRQAPSVPRRYGAPVDSSLAAEEIILNAFFEYQGIQRDAFQVLGLPAGSSYPSAQASFQRFYARSKDPSLILALETIKKHYRI